MNKDIREILTEVKKITGYEPALSIGSKHFRVQVNIEGTVQEFAIPKKFKAGCERNNFYSSMRRKINQRTEQIKARQLVTA